MLTTTCHSDTSEHLEPARTASYGSTDEAALQPTVRTLTCGDIFTCPFESQFWLLKSQVLISIKEPHLQEVREKLTLRSKSFLMKIFFKI